MKELRKKLQQLEEIMSYNNGQLRDCTNGTCWIDYESEELYEYTSDDLELSVKDLRNRELENIKIYDL